VWLSSERGGGKGCLLGARCGWFILTRQFIMTFMQQNKRKSQNMQILEVAQMIQFSQKSHPKSVFYDSDRIKAQVMGFESGQRIPPCKMDRDVVFLILSGSGKIIVDGEEEKIKKHSWVFVPKEIEFRSLQADTRMSVLAIQLR
jgi:quercetin dioxygenase-like cupin family protein